MSSGLPAKIPDAFCHKDRNPAKSSAVNTNSDNGVIIMLMSKAKPGMIIPYFLFIILTQSAVPALADPHQNSFSLSLTGGFLSDTTLGRFNPLPNTADVPAIMVSLENMGASFGVSIGYALKERFELQGSFTYGRSEIVYDAGIGLAGMPLGKTKVADAHNLRYCANILFYLTPTRIAPFLTAGLGLISLKPDKLPSSTKLLFSYGVGARIRLSRNISVFGDLKDHVGFFNYPRDFDVSYIAIYQADFKKTQHRIGINLGLSYAF